MFLKLNDADVTCRKERERQRACDDHTVCALVVAACVVASSVGTPLLVMIAGDEHEILVIAFMKGTPRIVCPLSMVPRI